MFRLRNIGAIRSFRYALLRISCRAQEEAVALTTQNAAFERILALEELESRSGAVVHNQVRISAIDKLRLCVIVRNADSVIIFNGIELVAALLCARLGC